MSNSVDLILQNYLKTLIIFPEKNDNTNFLQLLHWKLCEGRLGKICSVGELWLKIWLGHRLAQPNFFFHFGWANNGPAKWAFPQNLLQRVH